MNGDIVTAYRQRFGVAMLALVFAGCADFGVVDSRAVDPDANVRLGRSRAAIQGGELDSETRNVLALFNLKRQSLCSGSLLAPNVLLTARHCVAFVEAQVVQCGSTGFAQTDSASAFLATTAAVVDSSNVGEFRAQAVFVPEGFGDDICGSDVAIVVLDENIDEAVVTPLIPRLDQPMVPGEIYTAVGYGAVDNAGADSGKRRRREELKLTCAGKDCTLPEVADSEWLGDTGVCQGDSGGPALDSEGRVAGVVSRGSEDCSFPIYGDTNAFAEFIRDSVVKASGMGLYQAPEWTAGSKVDPRFSMPIGQLCSVDSDCPTGICVDEGEGRVCTRGCDEDHPCPLDYICQSTGRGNLCITEEVAPPPAYKRAERRSDCTWTGEKQSQSPWALWLFALLGYSVAIRRQRRCCVDRVGTRKVEHAAYNGEDRSCRMG